ncbi:hypothetical protein [Thalassotalea marina]|uniref:Uncharacterized protein n=1 Tax=Thalassotalea marina TaxID=1673741 RepID=A0A919EJR9_9GAMM|nr:hypothetical protein [Thalassotalea marina]GHF89595.1 hypothetical protein GCM10017161_16810 [Thalassotalea marina]
MYRWILLLITLVFIFPSYAAQTKEELLKEFNKLYFSIQKELQGKSLLEKIVLMEGKVEKHSTNPIAYDTLKQILATDKSVAGDYSAALSEFEYKSKIDELSLVNFDKYSPIEASTAISGLAKNTQIVMINEAHHSAQHRVLTYDLLSKLWQQGFRYFAAEALAENGEKFITNTYVEKNAGSIYVKETTFGQMLLLAKNIGFKLVSYDYGDQSTRKQRELSAAQNIIQKIFNHDKTAKVLIHVGYSHIKEQDGWLAEILKIKTGIDPLTINQTDFIETANLDKEPDIYKTIVERFDVDFPFILKSENDFWSANKGKYDVNVVWPRTQFKGNRPVWARLNRKTEQVDSSMCDNVLPCIIEVYDSNANGAFPSDRVYLSPTRQTSDVFISNESKYIRVMNLEKSKKLDLK